MDSYENFAQNVSFLITYIKQVYSKKHSYIDKSFVRMFSRSLSVYLHTVPVARFQFGGGGGRSLNAIKFYYILINIPSIKPQKWFNILKDIRMLVIERKLCICNMTYPFQRFCRMLFFTLRRLYTKQIFAPNTECTKK